MQKRRNSSALPMLLYLFCIKPSIYVCEFVIQIYLERGEHIYWSTDITADIKTSHNLQRRHNERLGASNHRRLDC